MKGLKISAFVLIGAALFGCDNSKGKTETESSTSSTPATQASNATAASRPDLSKTQDLIINEAKNHLPKKVDATSTVVDIHKEGDAIIYKYVMDVAKDEMDVDVSKQMTGDALKQLYCLKNNSSLDTFKAAFPAGAVHNYYIGDEMVFSIPLKPADCND